VALLALLPAFLLVLALRYPRPRRGSVTSGVRLRTWLTVAMGVPAMFLTPAASVADVLWFSVAAPLLVAVIDLIAWHRAVGSARRGETGVDFGLGRDWTRTASAGDPYRAQDRLVTLARGDPGAAAGAIVWAFYVRAAVLFIPIVPFAATRSIPRRARVGAAITMLNTARMATMQYRSTHGDSECPTVEQLIADKNLDAGFSTRDPWGGVIRIVCVDDDVIVRSPGPDKEWGTVDDLTIPRGAGGSSEAYSR
jgi:hypothetical protein